MSTYRRITLYYKIEDDQDSLRYALIGSLGKGKKTLFDKMIDQYLEDYGISNLEDLTLKDLQVIKKELIGVDKPEKEKRGRGRPRKVVENIQPKEQEEGQTEPPKNKEDESKKRIIEEKEIIKEEAKESSVEEKNTEKKTEYESKNIKNESNRKAEDEKEGRKSVGLQPTKTRSPMSTSISFDDEDEMEGEEDNDGVNMDLFGQMSAFMGD